MSFIDGIGSAFNIASDKSFGTVKGSTEEDNDGSLFSKYLNMDRDDKTADKTDRYGEYGEIGELQKEEKNNFETVRDNFLSKMPETIRPFMEGIFEFMSNFIAGLQEALGTQGKDYDLFNLKPGETKDSNDGNVMSLYESLLGNLTGIAKQFGFKDDNDKSSTNTQTKV